MINSFEFKNVKPVIEEDLAGFIETPEISAKRQISRPTIPPITISLKPLNPLV